LDFVASALNRSWRHCSWKRNRLMSSITCCCWHWWARSPSLMSCCLNCMHWLTVNQRDCTCWWSSTGHCVSCYIVSLGSMTRYPVQFPAHF